jgi:hypothetical protein
MAERRWAGGTVGRYRPTDRQTGEEGTPNFEDPNATHDWASRVLTKRGYDL